MIKVSATTASKSAINDFGWKLGRDNPGLVVRFLRGARMRTLQGVFDEIAAALQFPWYFGENFPALADCLGDLSWLGDNVALIFYDADQLLADAPNAKAPFYRAVRNAEASFSADELLHPDRTSRATFMLVLQCEQNVLEPVLADARTLMADCEVITISERLEAAHL